MNKYFVIDGNGKKHTRNSKRTYTHAVLYRENKDYDVKLASIKWPHHDENFWYHHAFLDGSSKWLERAPYEKDDAQFKRRVELDIERARRALKGCSTPDELFELEKREAMIRIEAKDYSLWHVKCWCGRRDLAMKEAHKVNAAQVIVLPVGVEKPTK